MTHTFAVYLSPLGFIRIEHLSSRLVGLRILDSAPDDLGHADRYTDMVYGEVDEYIRGKRSEFDIELDLSQCTPFQRLIYGELQRIPYGETRSYKQIAVVTDRPNASRAVGRANHCNPIQIIIPCHRVIGTNGALTGYAAGLNLKERLLSLERSSDFLFDIKVE